jgi:hypothetical protein
MQLIRALTEESIMSLARHIFRALVVLSLVGVSQLAWAGFKVEPTDAIVADDEATRNLAIASWKREGANALPPLFEMYDRLRAELTAPAQRGQAEADPKLALKIARLEAAIDEIANQRYAYQSRLYWYTDLDEAKAAAAKQGKPILSLRMLGKLTDDFSCANSRFFRTTLYANKDVSNLLREKFVLHWKSVRPVPKVTIDFGDGRKLERTLTGNSIHYVLAADGQIIDGIPGLYGPAAFRQQLETTLGIASLLKHREPGTRQEYITAVHRERLAQLERNWAKDYKAATTLLAASSASYPGGPGSPPGVPGQPTSLVEAKAALERALVEVGRAEPAAPPPATKAVKTAVPKQMIERPLVRAALPAETIPMNVTDDRLWQLIAQMHAADSKLDPASVRLISSQNPVAAHAAKLARTKADVESPLVRMVRTLEGSIATDTVRNEYQFHRQIHEWLANEPGMEVEGFNERVYAQLFLTPSSDPWLGLAPADTYTALPNAGVAVQEPRQVE